MDVLWLSRLQFAVATYFHFLFVPLTLGLSVLVAIFETKYVRTGDEEFKRITKFWGKLFLINFAVGIVTGITLEFQFGTNWSKYSEYVGDVFGSLLAIEATLAFFLESTFLGVWIFGWEKLSKKMHATAIWLVAIASNISAYWILAANSWMQHPVGFTIRNGRAELTDFWAVVFQKYTIIKFVHQISSAYALAGFFILGISAWHILRKNKVSFFVKSFKTASTFALFAILISVFVGHISGGEVAEAQPSKLAAMESLWEDEKPASIALFLVPDAKNEKNSVEFFHIPAALSMLAFHNPKAPVRGLKSFPKDERPPVMVTFVSFRLMVGLGFLLILIAFYAWGKREVIENYPKFLKILPFVIPLPYLAIELGWTLAEVGRQPWIVYGIMKTAHGVSNAITTPQVATSLIGFFLIYSLLGIADFYLLFKYARKGPEDK